MPPHLHPRSTATSTLFAGTLLASFVVVGIPHVFPCPRPRTAYAHDAGQIQLDDDGKPIPRKVKQGDEASAQGDRNTAKLKMKSQNQASKGPQKAVAHSRDLDEETALFEQLAAEASLLEAQAKAARECPVPKPTGWVGRVLGFEAQTKVVVRENEKG